MAIRVDVVLLSGQTASVTMMPDDIVYDVKLAAQKKMQIGLHNLFGQNGQLLEDWWCVKHSCLKDGDVINASVRCSMLASSSKNPAFALIRSDGSVQTWGDAESGGNSDSAAEKLRNVRRICASSGAFAAIVSDGSVVTWGAFFCGGHCGSAVQRQLSKVRELQASHRAFAALREDGRVVTWGDVGFGGDSSSVQEELYDVRQISSARRAFAAIRADGSVVTWGDSDTDSREVEGQLREVRLLCATEHAFAALRADGTVISWGRASHGGDSSEVQDKSSTECVSRKGERLSEETHIHFEILIC